MSVTKSRKISNWTFLVLVVISIVMCLAFFLGGSHMEGSNKAYELTGSFLTWVYILTGLTLLVTLVFAISAFAKRFKNNAKDAITSLSGAIGLIILLVVTYLMGNGDATTMTAVNEDSQKYLTEGWLKTADMVLYSSYVLIVVIACLIVWGVIRSRIISKK